MSDYMKQSEFFNWYWGDSWYDITTEPDLSRGKVGQNFISNVESRINNAGARPLQEVGLLVSKLEDVESFAPTNLTAINTEEYIEKTNFIININEYLHLSEKINYYTPYDSDQFLSPPHESPVRLSADITYTGIKADLYFYNYITNELIGIAENINSGETGFIFWNGLKNGQKYGFYVKSIIDDTLIRYSNILIFNKNATILNNNDYPYLTLTNFEKKIMTSGSLGDGSHKFTALNLSSLTTYFYRSYAKDKQGNIKYGDIEEVFTADPSFVINQIRNYLTYELQTFEISDKIEFTISLDNYFETSQSFSRIQNSSSSINTNMMDFELISETSSIHYNWNPSSLFSITINQPNFLIEENLYLYDIFQYQGPIFITNYLLLADKQRKDIIHNDTFNNNINTLDTLNFNLIKSKEDIINTNDTLNFNLIKSKEDNLIISDNFLEIRDNYRLYENIILNDTFIEIRDKYRLIETLILSDEITYQKETTGNKLKLANDSFILLADDNSRILLVDEE